MRKDYWTKAEDEYLIRNYCMLDNRELMEGIIFISKVPRSKKSIYTRACNLEITGPARTRKRREALLPPEPVYIKKITPVIQNVKLFKILENKDLRLQDIAEVAGERIETIRGYIHQGGLPQEFVKPVKELMEGAR